MAAGDYIYFRRQWGSDLTTQVALASGVTGSTGVLTVRNSTTSINIQRIRLIPTTYGVGSITFREVDATGTVIATMTQPAADVTGNQASGPQFNWSDFGPKGWKMTVGTSLFMVRSSATGPGANLVIEAYGTTSGPVAQGTSN
jgi:hypothetical protein